MIGIVLCVVFGALLIMNLTIIIKGLVNPDEPPSVFGVTPMVVKSGSMSSDLPHRVVSGDIIELTEEQIQSLKVGDTFQTKSGDYIETNIVETVSKSENGNIVFTASRPASDHIEVDDLIFVSGSEFQDLQVGQIITFFEANDRGDRTGKVVTHRIIEVTQKDGAVAMDFRQRLPFNSRIRHGELTVFVELSNLAIMLRQNDVVLTATRRLDFALNARIDAEYFFNPLNDFGVEFSVLRRPIGQTRCRQDFPALLPEFVNLFQRFPGNYL
ncbi:MAG: hypothetical protein J6W93_02570 [Clostridia bacterium]|nr:hypothetical protein [Clostridia bacterium]